MNKIKLIALDMDGTLLTNNHEIAPKTIEAIHYAKAKGVKVILATGRPLSTCFPYAQELQLEDYVIVSNGAEIWDMKKELIERSVMRQDLIEKLWSIGETLQADMWLISTEDFYLSSNPPKNFKDEEWLKIGYGHLEEQKKEAILAELQYFHDEIEISNSYPDNLEINKKGINKAEAILKVCQRESILMEEVLVAGDGLNDKKMIEQAGVGVAMGNGQEAIKQIADYVTTTNEADGVAKAIYQYI